MFLRLPGANPELDFVLFKVSSDNLFTMIFFSEQRKK